MEVEKIVPVASSPLDSCRGRGKHGLLPRIRSTRPRTSPSATCGKGVCDTPLVVMLIISDSSPKVGALSNGK